jgi:hypothetical protein
MKTIFKTLIVIKLILLTSLFAYSKDFSPVIEKGYGHNLEGAHYNYHYKNGVNHKKYNKPEIEEKRPEVEKMRERYNDKTDYNRDVDRLNNTNIEKGNEIKMKFRNEKNIHLDYEPNH